VLNILQVRIYEVNEQRQSQGKAAYAHDAPILDVCWSRDGSKVFSGGVDKAAKLFDLNSGQSQQVGAHDEPIRAVRWIDAPTGGILATGSWDKTIKVSYHATSFYPSDSFSFLSIGTYELLIQLPPSPWLSESTPWMFNTL
jgi:WD40 repeat protein